MGEASRAISSKKTWNGYYHQPMTREQVAATVVARALRLAGASADLTYRLALGHDRPNQRLSVAVPAYERTGRAATLYWLNHSVKGLGLTGDELHDVTTW